MKTTLDMNNAARLAAYRQKLNLWRAAHPEEYWERLRKGLMVRARWRRLWELQDRQHRQVRAPGLYLISSN